MSFPRFSHVLAALASVAALLPLRADPKPAATRNGYTVTLDVQVNEKGDPQDVKVVKSEDVSAGDVITKMAIAMAEKAKLPVREKDGHAVPYVAREPFFFPIEDDEGPEAQKSPMAHPKMEVGKALLPVYPEELAARDEVGGVILEMSVDAEGKVTELKTLRASDPEFEEAALKAVKNWTFNPAKEGERPVASRFRLAIAFDTSDKMADLKWRIAPRPQLGTHLVYHDNTPRAAQPAGPAPAPTPDAKPAEPTPPAK